MTIPVDCAQIDYEYNLKKITIYSSSEMEQSTSCLFISDCGEASEYEAVGLALTQQEGGLCLHQQASAGLSENKPRLESDREGSELTQDENRMESTETNDDSKQSCCRSCTLI